MRLVRASREHRSAFLEAARIYHRHGDLRHDGALAAFDAYLAKVQGAEDPTKVTQGRVPQTTFWLLDDRDRLVATARLRHRLSPSLLIEGGHVGYDVRPDVRGRGLGTHLLALVLEKAWGRGIERVLVTCDQDNVASARVIEKNGGCPWSPTVSPDSGKVVSRYWIDPTVT